MSIGELLRKIRQEKMSQGALAEAIGTSQDAISRIERGTQIPDAALVVAAARHLDSPELLLAYCEQCPVCSAFLPITFPTLDNIPTHPTTVAHKAAEEAREAAEALDELFRLFDRLDWADSATRRERAVELLVQVRDIELAIRILYESLFLQGVLPLEVLTEVSRRQHNKCIDRGYCKPTGTCG